MAIDPILSPAVCAPVLQKEATVETGSGEQVHLLSSALAALPEGLIVINCAGELLYANDAGRALLAANLPQQDVVHVDLLGDDLVTGEPPPLIRALHGDVIVDLPLTFHGPDGATLHVVCSAAPVRDDTGNIIGAVGSFADVSPIHDLEELREDMLRAASHDLRGPLTVIQGHAEHLLNRLQSGGIEARDRHSLISIIKSTRRMSVMIRDLLEAGRLQTGQIVVNPQRLDLVSFLRSYVSWLSGAPESDVLQLRVHGYIPPVLADPNRLERILQNLLLNAIRYSPISSPVMIEVTPLTREVQIAITDEGLGIPPEDLSHIFKRFYRGKGALRANQGLGLGLYITKMLVEAQGGRIWVESTVGQGSTFGFTIPNA